MSDASIDLTPSQRAAAQTRIHENLALRSGAGCGKTLVLALRFTSLLMANPNANPLKRLVALTFTDKAAVEMTQRVRKVLAGFAASAKQNRVKILQWLEELPEARISTIHAFCSKLLRSHAIEAGLDPAFKMFADELAAARLAEEAADEAILAAVETHHDDVVAMLSRLPYGRLLGHVRSLVLDRTAIDWALCSDPGAITARWQEQIKLARPQQWERTLGSPRLAQMMKYLDAIPCADPNDKVNLMRLDLLESLHRALREGDSLRELPAITMPRGGSRKAWGSQENLSLARSLAKSILAVMDEYRPFLEELGPLDADSAKAIATICRLAQEAIAIYAARKRQSGMLDFVDLLDYTAKLLSSQPQVAQELRDSIDQLLVDEAQDTDEFQLRLLERLIFDESGQTRLPEGKLFIVGDAKQSIYRFRGARVEVFNDLCRRLGPGKQEGLDLSFRTHQGGVDFVNHVFESLMPAYESIQAKRNIVPPDPSVEILLTAMPQDKPKPGARDAARAQAAVTADRIAQMVQGQERRVWDRAANDWRPARYGDVAILFSRMTSSLDFERELALRGVPYYVVAGTGYFQQQEVWDALNALAAVDNPFDDIAFFGVLRSSMVGLDDNSLMHIAMQCAPPYLPALRSRLRRDGKTARVELSGLSRDQNDALAFAVDLLTRLHSQKDATSVADTLDELLAQMAYEATLLCQTHNGNRALGNVRMLLDRARASQATTLAEFLAEIRQLVLDESRYEQSASASEDADVVRIMTIHKAKGLEFPVVFLPDLNAGRKNGKTPLLSRSDWGLTLELSAADEPNGGPSDDDEDETPPAKAPLSWRLATMIDNQDDQAECVRRLYVAMTRHQDHLVLVGADWRSKDGDFRSGGCFLRNLDQVLDLQAAAERGSLSYGPGRHALVRRITPTPPPRRQRPCGEKIDLLKQAQSPEDLTGLVLAQSPASAPAAGSLLAQTPASAWRCEIAATALSEFEHCPTLYRWRYELRVPGRYLVVPAEQTPAPAEAQSLDPATLGTVYHRCMELLDLADPQPSALVARVLDEMDLQIPADALSAELGQMIDNFRPQPLWRELATARKSWRELSFLMDVSGSTVRGQIDLIYQDAGGHWHIVDYKSDRVEGQQLADRAANYELQMMLYAWAAKRYLGQAPVDATLYFLRPAVEHRFVITPDALQSVQQRTEGLMAQLLDARRQNVYEARRSDRCGHCDYRTLCGKT